MRKQPKAKTIVNLNEIVSGIMLSLTARGYKTFDASSEKWAQAFAASMPTLEREARRSNLDVRSVRVVPRRIYGNSENMDAALYVAKMNGLVTLDYPASDVYRPTLEATDALSHLDSFPGKRAFYESITSKFLAEFDKVR